MSDDSTFTLDNLQVTKGSLKYEELPLTRLLVTVCTNVETIGKFCKLLYIHTTFT